jgi:hypothetical protein
MITFYQDCVIYEIDRDGYGKPVKKNEQNLKCRVKEKYQLIKDKSAVDTVSELQITLPNDAVVKPDDKVEFEGKEYAIISVKNTRNTLAEVIKKVVYV